MAECQEQGDVDSGDETSFPGMQLVAVGVAPAGEKEEEALLHAGSAAAKERLFVSAYSLHSSPGTGGIEQEWGRARSRRRAGRGAAIRRKQVLVSLLHSQGFRRRHASAGR